MKRKAMQLLQLDGAPNKHYKADRYEADCYEADCYGADPPSPALQTSGEHEAFDDLNPSGLLCGSENCDSCFARSLASHHRVASFLAANPLENVFEIQKTSHTTYGWQCFDCDDIFKATCFIVMLDSWCPKCTKKI